MAFYKFDEGSAKGRTLRDGHTALQDTRHKLNIVLGAMNAMTDAQIATEYGFADATVAGQAKAEISSAVGKLNSNASQENVDAALQQFLDQFA